MKPISEFIEEFKEYRSAIEELHRKSRIERRRLENAKMKTFFSFLERVTGLKPEEYSYDAFVIKSRSRPDAVTGNVVVEFEDDLSLDSEVREAEAQLAGYVKELYSRDPRRYWAIATDGIRFIVYTSTGDGEVVLRRVYEIKVLRDDPLKFYWFLYEYFFEERFDVELKPENFVLRFGYESRVFNETMNLLKSLWNRISGMVFAKTVFNEWSKYYTNVTGKEYKDVELFLRHTYLALLAKILAYMYLEEGVGARLGDIGTLEKVVSGEYFRNLGLEIFERDYFSWVVAVDEVKNDFLWGIHDVLLKELLGFNYSTLDTDVFKEIYQNIIERDERAALGEYYTPDFVAELMLRELLTKNPEAKVLDPACGSGTFLFIAIKLKKELLKDRLPKHEILHHILNSVVGIDINPVATVIARANYLIAIRDLLPAKGILRIPVYLANAITIPEYEKDTLMVKGPEGIRVIEVLRMEGATEKEYFFLPRHDLARKLGVEGLDTFIGMIEDAVKLLSREEDERKLVEEVISRYIDKLGVNLTDEEKISLAHILLHNARIVHKYVSEKRDTFWLFILRNQYKVFLLQGLFDVVVGNPPWVSRTDVESERFRRWYDRVMDFYHVPLRSEFLGAPADTVIPFVIHSVSYYLRPSGYLYFVLPASVLRGYQYEVLRGEEGVLKIHKVVNLEEVKIHDQSRGRVDTIFNVPCILLLVRKEVEKSVKEIEGVVYKGTIKYKSRNAPYTIFTDAVRKGFVKAIEGIYTIGPQNILVFKTRGEEKELGLPDKLLAFSKTRKSPYLDKVIAGIGAYPRNFFLVQIPKPRYGLDLEHVYVKTHPRAVERKGEGEGKDRWIQVLEGRIPSKYLYLLVMGDNVFPFGVWGLSIAVLPAITDYTNNRFFVLDIDRILVELGEWYLKGVREHYIKERGKDPSEEDVKGFIKWLLDERVNYHQKFVKQKPKAYTLVYNTSGDALNMGSAVINREEVVSEANRLVLEKLGVGNDIQMISGLVVDYTNYMIDFDDAYEAHYLCALLQSTPVRQNVHRLQTRGKKGPRHITDRPFQLPIPRFIAGERASDTRRWGLPESDIEDLRGLQLELANLSAKLHENVGRLLEKYVYIEHGIPFVNTTDKALSSQSVGTIRKKIRHDIAEYQEKIDEVAFKLLNLTLKNNLKARSLLDYIKPKQ